MANFKYALSLAQTLYDIEGDIEDLEEIGLIAYNFIGNKNTILKKITLDVKDGVVELPCEINFIEAVVYGMEDWNYTSNIKQNGDPQSSIIEEYIESEKYSLDPYYISGKYVKYKRNGNKLYVNKGFNKVTVLYHEEVLDEDGLPEINEKEAVAVADYIAYTLKYKEAIKTNNASIFQMAQVLKQQWLFHCDAARVSDYVNQNEMDAILNAQSSWNRKTFGKSYKSII